MSDRDVETKDNVNIEQRGEPAELDEAAVDDIIARNMANRKARRGNKRDGYGKLPKIMIMLVVCAALFALSFTELFTVDTIKVSGNGYFTEEEIIHIAHAEKGVNLFYGVKSREMKKYLKANPYIEDCKIFKIPMGTVKINVEERRQIAGVVYGEEYLIIDKEGRLLRKTGTQPKITLLRGIKVTNIKVGEIIGVEDERILEHALGLIAKMEEGDVYFVEIEMSEMYIKAHVYDSLICVGDYEDLTDAIDKNRLQQILNELFKRGVKRGTITFDKDGYASFKPTV